MSIHIYHTSFQRVEHNLACSKSSRHVQNTYNFRLRIVDTLDILNMQHATRGLAPLEGCIGPKSALHIPRNESNFVFLRNKRIVIKLKNCLYLIKVNLRKFSRNIIFPECFSSLEISRKIKYFSHKNRIYCYT